MIVKTAAPALDGRLSRMKSMLRFPGAVRRDPAIDVWLEKQVPALGAIARRWFGRMRQCGSDVRELMHDGYPTACVEDAAFGYVGVFTAHANVGFFQGAELKDPGGLLLGDGKRMRHVKVWPGVDLDEAALQALIDAAYTDIKLRLAEEDGNPIPPGPRRRQCTVPNMKQSIVHVALVVRDYDEAIAFYTKTLDFTLIEDTYQPEQDKRWVVVAPPGSHGTSLLLARASTPEQEAFVGNQTGGRVFLFLNTDDFWRDYAKLTSLGVTFVREPKTEAYGTVAVFKDLYGNLWDLLQLKGVQ